jgi:hypothetical protein
MYIKCEYCKTSIERLLSEHGNDSFQITIHWSTYIINIHTYTISWIYFTTFQCVDLKKKKFDFWCFSATFNNISAISMANSFSVGGSQEYPERTTNHGQATGKLYHLRLRVECTLFNSPSQMPRELLPSLGVRRPSVVRSKLSHLNLRLRSHWTNCNQILLEWSLVGPPSKIVSGDPDFQPIWPLS